MFPSGRTFLAQCAAVLETLDGAEDVALMMLGAEITTGVAKTAKGVAKTAKGVAKTTPGVAKSGSSSKSAKGGVAGLPAAHIARKAAAR